jgi:hypothetical protein
MLNLPQRRYVGMEPPADELGKTWFRGRTLLLLKSSLQTRLDAQQRVRVDSATRIQRNLRAKKLNARLRRCVKAALAVARWCERERQRRLLAALRIQRGLKAARRNRQLRRAVVASLVVAKFCQAQRNEARRREQEAQQRAEAERRQQLEEVQQRLQREEQQELERQRLARAAEEAVVVAAEAKLAVGRKKSVIGSLPQVSPPLTLRDLGGPSTPSISPPSTMRDFGGPSTPSMARKGAQQQRPAAMRVPTQWLERGPVTQLVALSAGELCLASGCSLLSWSAFGLGLCRAVLVGGPHACSGSRPPPLFAG